MRVLVCGGRYYNDVRLVYEELGTLRPAVVIHGGASGADRIAGRWAIENKVRVECYPAMWRLYGRGAGPRRNQAMIDRGRPDVVLAFPGGKGTTDMVKRAELAGIRVVRLPDHVGAQRSE